MFGIALMCSVALTSPIGAQSIDDRLDLEAYLHGIVELRLPEVLDTYIRSHPADSEVTAALYDLARGRLAANDPDSTLSARRDAVDAVLKRRRALIDENPSDVRRARWLLDQASDLYFESLAGDGTDVVILYGLPTREQRERARRVADAMHACVRDADRAIADVMPDLGTSRPALREWYVREERERRIPLLEGVADIVLAIAGPSDRAKPLTNPRTWFARGADTIEPLGLRLGGRQANLAQIYLARALSELDELDAAEARLRAISADAMLDPRQSFLVKLGLVDILGRRDGPAAALREVDEFERTHAGSELFYRLILADMRARWTHAATPVHDARSMRAVYQPYLDLMANEPPVTRAALRDVIVERLEVLITADLPVASTPVIITMALANRELISNDTRAAGIERVRTLLKQPGLSPDEIVDAMFMLATAAQDDGRLRDAADRLLQIAREHPASRRAEVSVELGVAIASMIAGDPKARPDDLTRLRSGLELLLTTYPNLKNINRWREASGQLALREGRFEEALDAFDSVTVGSALWHASQMDRVRVRRAWADQVPAGERPGRLREVLREADTVRPALQRSAEGSVAQDRAVCARLLKELDLVEAEVRLLLGEPRIAVALVTPHVADHDLPPDVLGRALYIKIQAHRALDEFSEARASLESFAQTSPGRVATVVHPMLDTLNADYERLRDQRRDDEAAALAQAEILPLTEIIAEIVAEPAPALARAIADGERHAGAFARALARYEELLKAYPNASELLIGRAECLFALTGDGDAKDPRLAEAMRLYRRIAASGEESIGAEWWLSQLRMLQILDRIGRNTQKIRPQIATLRLRDASLGGPRYEPHFLALERRH
jgi:tetratricopeptide (TPR) repeat protein